MKRSNLNLRALGFEVNLAKVGHFLLAKERVQTIKGDPCL